MRVDDREITNHNQIHEPDHVIVLDRTLIGPSVLTGLKRDGWIILNTPDPPSWLLIRRSLEPKPEVKYYISNADAHVPLGTLAQVTGVRWRVEELFEECKGYLGMGHYEARAWTSWHHHRALVAVAHLFLTLTRLRLKKRRQRSRCQ